MREIHPDIKPKIKKATRAVVAAVFTQKAPVCTSHAFSQLSSLVYAYANSARRWRLANDGNVNKALSFFPLSVLSYSLWHTCRSNRLTNLCILSANLCSMCGDGGASLWTKLLLSQINTVKIILSHYKLKFPRFATPHQHYDSTRRIKLN